MVSPRRRSKGAGSESHPRQQQAPFAFFNCGSSSMDDSPMGVQQQQRPQQREEPPRSVRSLMHGIMSPLLSCVQPPLANCGAPSTSWDPRRQPSMVSPIASSNSFQQRPIPCAIDVLCGRGGGSSRQLGNLTFREVIAANKATYSTLTKKQKMMMARQVVDLIHNAGGSFLSRDATTGLWQDIGLPRSLEKTSQALREKTKPDESEEADEQPASVISCNSEGSDQQTAVANNRTMRKAKSNDQAQAIVVPPHLQAVYAPSRSRGNGQSPQMPRLHELSYPYPQPLKGDSRLPFRLSRAENLAGMQPPASLMNQMQLEHPGSFPPGAALPSQDLRHTVLPLAASAPPPPPPPSPQYATGIQRHQASSIMREKVNISPERQQEWKRQRMSASSTASTTTSTASSSDNNLSTAIQSQLSLEERVIRPLQSPAFLQQGRSRTRPDREDGLAALSTAAFLRLDESS